MELNYSSRAILQTSHAPIDFDEEPRDDRPLLKDPGRPAIERAAILRLAAMTDDELAEAKEREADPGKAALLDAMRSAEPAHLIAAIHEHDDEDGRMVRELFDQLVELRQNRIRKETAALKEWVDVAERRLVDERLAVEIERTERTIREDLQRASLNGFAHGSRWRGGSRGRSGMNSAVHTQRGGRVAQTAT